MQSVGEVNMKMSNGQSIPVATNDYVRLIDGDISQVKTSSYEVRRRVKGDTLYLDVYQNGSYIGSRKHNQPVKRHGVQTISDFSCHFLIMRTNIKRVVQSPFTLNV